MCSRVFEPDDVFTQFWNIATPFIFISFKNQVGLHRQKTNEQDNQAHNMLSQLPAATDRKVKQQYNFKKYI